MLNGEARPDRDMFRTNYRRANDWPPFTTFHHALSSNCQDAEPRYLRALIPLSPIRPRPKLEDENEEERALVRTCPLRR